MKQSIIISLASLSLLVGVAGALLETKGQEITTAAATFGSTEQIINAPKIDTTPPTIKGQKNWEIFQGEKINVLDGVVATDNSGNTLPVSVSEFSTEVAQEQSVTLTATDSNHKETTEQITITVKPAIKKETPKKVATTTNITKQPETQQMPVIEPVVTQDNSTTENYSVVQTSTQEETNSAPITNQSNTLSFSGVTIPYQNAGEATGQSIINNDRNMVATFGGAAYQSADDGVNTHFIGHNPGIFSHLFSLVIGDKVVVTDANGNPSTYLVSSILQVDDYGTNIATNENWVDYILDPGSEERITLQTCINADINLVVIAFPA